MLETAYVLPILVGVVLFIVETLSYAMNSLIVNDVLTDAHLAIVDEVQEISALDDASAYSSVFGIYCDGGLVKLPLGSNDAIKTLVVNALTIKGVTLLESDPGTLNITSDTDSEYGFDHYVIRFNGTANTLTLPVFLNELLPMSVDTVISIKASCQTP
ncbi:hypothetical protein [Thiomicrorhabdus marina]|nr:hypothetical protein [Thiomicrorhabdus marina]